MVFLMDECTEEAVSLLWRDLRVIQYTRCVLHLVLQVRRSVGTRKTTYEWSS